MKKLIILIVFTLSLTACAVKEPADQILSVEENQTAIVDQTQIAPPTQEDADALPEQASVIIKTNKGDITIELLPKSAPLTVVNFLNLARAGFYNNIKFHRVIPDFMIQTGDPNSKDNNWYDDGTGGPGYYFADEVLFDDQLVRGTVAMANAGPNTNGSQFFIVTAEAVPWLNGQHTIFGKVVEGMEAVDAIEQVRTTGDQGQPPNHPVEDVVIEDLVFKDLGAKVWGLEQNRAHQALSSSLNLDTLYGSAEDMNKLFGEQKFDIIISNNFFCEGPVLQSKEQAKMIIGQINNSLQQGGLSVNAIDYLKFTKELHLLIAEGRISQDFFQRYQQFIKSLSPDSDELRENKLSLTKEDIEDLGVQDLEYREEAGSLIFSFRK